MNSFVFYFQRCRQSVFALIAVALCMLLTGYLWSTWYMREPLIRDEWHRNGYEIVDSIEGVGATRQEAEFDASRKAVVKVNGLGLSSDYSFDEKDTTVMTSDSLEFTNSRNFDNRTRSYIKNDVRLFVEYLKSWKDDDKYDQHGNKINPGNYHVKIKAIVKKIKDRD